MMEGPLVFFSWLYQHCEVGNINFRFLREGEKISEFLPLGILFEEADRITQTIERHSKLNSFFGVALREGNNGKKEGVIAIPALWVDLDDAPLQKVSKSPFPPSAVVETRPGRFHVYWKLREPAGREDIGKVENILKRLSAYFHGDASATDASRVLRIPGSLNFKNDSPHLVTVKSLSSLEYDLSDLLNSDLPEIEPPAGKVCSGNPNNGDRIKKIMECIFLQHCDGDQATLPEPEWYAMISVLAREIGGPATIHWLSRGYPKYSPQETDVKILHALSTPPMTCQKIKTLWDCRRDCGVKSPATLGWKIKAEYAKTTDLEFPDVMAGFASDFAATYASFLEVPKEFFYMGALTCLGNILADRIALNSEIPSQPRFYTLLLGESAFDRKSTAVTKLVDFFKETISDFKVSWGINSAEGFQKLLKDGGRLLLCFDEFKSFLGKAKIENSVLLPCVNTLFESNRYQAVTKEHNILMEGVYLSILAASTIDTYENTWSPQFTDIGFNNRLFIVPGTAERKFSYPEKIPDAKKAALKSRLRDVLYHALICRELELTTEAKESYHAWYMSLAGNPSIHARRIDLLAHRTGKFPPALRPPNLIP